MTSDKKAATAKPLNGLVVVDLSRVLSGPFCTMSLADLGAEVIKVEEPGKGDDTRHWGPPFLNGESTYFLSVNRGKKSVTLNLKEPRACDLLRCLLQRADILVENFRPGTLDRLGFSHARLSQDHPRLIYASISGYGSTGPRAAEPGYDVVILGESGVMSITGYPDGPPTKMGISIADVLTGLYAFQGILLALYSREKTGLGSHVDVALLDCMVTALTYQAGIYFATEQDPQRLGNRHPSLAPYEAFMAQDGYLIVGVGNESQWQKFCLAVELPDLARDPRFDSMACRIQNYTELRSLLAVQFAKRPAQELIARFRGAGIPCGHIRSISEVFADPQLAARNMILEHQHATAGAVCSVGNPIHIEGQSHYADLPAPMLGQHNHEIFVDRLGLPESELHDLQAASVI
jgi:crotonobetainyl-CoA:carnitine CoA-transferase CaiB-like acyl-CoA transferase